MQLSYFRRANLKVTNTYSQVILVKLLFFYTTWFYLFLSILTAHFPSIGLAITVARDLWIFLGIAIIMLYGNVMTIFAVSFTTLTGTVAHFLSNESSSILVLGYGVRDIIFLGTFLTLARFRAVSFSPLIPSARYFITFVVICAGFSIILQIAKLSDLRDYIFATSKYFEAKNINSNVNGGILGQRLLEPLYSASLVGTLLAGYALYTAPRITSSITAFALSFFTLAKVVPVFLYFRILRRFPVVALCVIFVSLIFIYMIASSILANMPISIYTFHAASILDRFNIFFNLPKFSELVLPRPLGFNSVAGHVINSIDASKAPESLIISKIYDLGIWSAPLILWILHSIYAAPRNIRPLICAFIFIQLFSSLSNHLVAFLPLLILSYDAHIRRI